jgi:glycosyltransferase involved in cell wall biosynthesis
VPALTTVAPLRTLLHAFSSFEFGGAQARFVHLANSLAGRYRHLIVAMDGNTQAADRLNPDVHFDLVPFRTMRGNGLANRGACREALERLRPDMLLTYNWGAIEWVAANLPAVVPHVHVEDGFGPAERQKQLPRRVWTRRVLLGPIGHATVVVPSRRLAELAGDWWVPARRLHYIPNGVPIPADAKARPPLPPGRVPVIGTVAGLRAEKNVARLVRAVAALPEDLPARLLVVGDGPEREALQRFAADLGLGERAEFTGYLTNPSAALKRMDLFALSSDTEQQPISMMEAMAAGLPVCATRVGDVPQILPPQARDALCIADDDKFKTLLAEMIRGRERWPDLASAGLVHLRREHDNTSLLMRWREVFDGQIVPANRQSTLCADKRA